MIESLSGAELESALESMMVSEINVDAQLVHIREKQVEIIKKSRDVVKKLIKVRRDLSNKKRKLAVLEREWIEKITKADLGLERAQRRDVASKAIHVKNTITAEDGCKDIYEEIDLLETKASELELIWKLNLHINDDIHDMQLSLQSQMR